MSLTRKEQTMVHVKKCPYCKRGKASTEFYIGDKPQIYCYGWIDPQNDEVIDVCKNCADHVSRAQEDLERSRR